MSQVNLNKDIKILKASIDSLKVNSNNSTNVEPSIPSKIFQLCEKLDKLIIEYYKES